MEISTLDVRPPYSGDAISEDEQEQTSSEPEDVVPLVETTDLKEFNALIRNEILSSHDESDAIINEFLS